MINARQKMQDEIHNIWKKTNSIRWRC